MLDNSSPLPFLAAGRRQTASSHGERRILELAMTLLTEPRLLLLDELCRALPEETATVIDVIGGPAANCRSRSWWSNTT